MIGVSKYASQLFCSIVFGLIISTASGQNQKVIYPHSVFWSKTEINQLDNNFKWGVGLDFVYRRKSGLNDNFMLSERLRESIRPWIHYQFSPYSRLSISPIGFMYTNEYLGKPSDLNRLPYHEIRTTVQFFHHTKMLDGKIMHTWRYRYELRWQENPSTDSYRYFSRFRIRYRIRYVINGNDFYKNNTAYVAISNEIGLNIGKNVVYNTFNQNRLYVGVGYRVFNTARIELRYVNRIRTRGATGYEFDNGRGVMLGIYFDSIKGFGKASDDYKIQFTD
jgi:hypothetical protein